MMNRMGMTRREILKSLTLGPALALAAAGDAAAAGIQGGAQGGAQDGAQDGAKGGESVATLLACGGPQILMLSLRFVSGKAEIVSREDWEAGQSPGMPADMVARFKTTDDCKSIDGGSRILVTSSAGAVAIVERASRRTEFHAIVPGAHSAEVLPGGRVVAAASTAENGNRLIVFDRAKSGVELFTTPLVSAHGTHWIQSERTLWTLNRDELRAYELADWTSDKPSLTLRESFKLPSRGGHDLSPVPGTSSFIVTTEHEALIFDRKTSRFTPHPALGGLVNVKSASIHPVTGRTAFTTADSPEWWTRTVRFLDPAATLAFPNDRLYKVRWA
jgi:hypothetical protein